MYYWSLLALFPATQIGNSKIIFFSEMEVCTRAFCILKKKEKEKSIEQL